VLLQVLRLKSAVKVVENVVAKMVIILVWMVSGVHPNLVHLVRNAKTQMDCVLIQVLRLKPVIIMTKNAVIKTASLFVRMVHGAAPKHVQLVKNVKKKLESVLNQTQILQLQLNARMMKKNVFKRVFGFVVMAHG